MWRIPYFLGLRKIFLKRYLSKLVSHNPIKDQLIFKLIGFTVQGTCKGNLLQTNMKLKTLVTSRRRIIIKDHLFYIKISVWQTPSKITRIRISVSLLSVFFLGEELTKRYKLKLGIYTTYFLHRVNLSFVLKPKNMKDKFYYDYNIKSKLFHIQPVNFN